MDKLKGYALIAAGFVVLVVALVLSLPREAHAPNVVPVLVTNTSAQPVPTVAQGTTNVAGTVNLAASTSVGLSGTPSVRDADNPALQPVQIEGACRILFSLGGCNTGQIYTVQSGKRLVVEFVSSTANLATTHLLETFDVVTTAGGHTTNHFLSPSHHFDDGTTVSFWSASLAIRLYADAGTSVTLQCTQHELGTGTEGCSFTFSGYLVSVP